MSDTMSSTPMGEHDMMDDATAAFLADLTGEADPRKRHPEAPEGNDEATETEHEETAPAEDNEGEGEEPADKEIDPDDAEVDIKVGEETKKATIKELKRLYGQEASLTQKSQKLAESQRVTDGRFQMANAALNNLLSKAQAHHDQYAGIDFFVAAQQMDTETFQALRQDASAAEAQVKFLKEELGTLTKTQQEETQRAYQTAAQECLKVLADTEKGIPGWGKPMYDDMTAFADKHGAQGFRQLTDPAALKIVHMAMQWEKAEASRKSAQGKVQASPNKPSKVLRPGPSKTGGQGQQKTAMQQHRRDGSIDTATDAFLALMKR